MQLICKFTSILLFIIFTSISKVFPADKDAMSFIESARKKIERVNDFSAEISVTVNVDFLKVPISKAKIYFRRPDKISVKSENGFAMLPKQGLGIPVILFQDNYTAVLIKHESIGGQPNAVIKMIPLNENEDILLATIWINERSSSISRIIYSTKHGNIAVDFEYNSKISSVGLPAKALIKFELPTFALPRTLSGDLTSDNKSKHNTNEPVKGTATVVYGAYIVNKGISDTMFTSKK